MRTPLLHWLSLRLRLLLAAALLTGGLLPPYVPGYAIADDDVTAAAPQFLFVEEGFLMKTSTIGTQGTRLAFSEGLVHTVEPGESLQKIADTYGISPQTIRWANGLSASSTVNPGEEIVILPVDGVLHTVRRGETLAKIADLYDIPEASIVRQNKIKGGFILAGEQIIVPGGKPVIDSPGVIASVNQALRFTDRLPAREIQLGTKVVTGKVTPGGFGAAPAVSAVITQAFLQAPCGPDCKITQGFHSGHYAIDMQVRGGAPIFAAEAGTVIRAELGYNGGYGNVIEIDHGNGIITLYAHNKELYVKEGDHVERGQPIAFMGNTGRVHGPTGIHTHFEVHVNGVKKDPRLYIQ